MANGDCYAANGREMIGADDSARLVHGVGILQTDGKPFGHCWIEKGGKCIELKSLKYYFVSFRNVGIYQEGATKRIHDDLKNALETKKIKVTTIYNTRGGFDTTCVEGKID